MAVIRTILLGQKSNTTGTANEKNAAIEIGSRGDFIIVCIR